jgi:hypothetical protein
MEPEGSLSCLQDLSTDPYPEPDQSKPYHSIVFLSKIYFNIILPPMSWLSYSGSVTLLDPKRTIVRTRTLKMEGCAGKDELQEQEEKTGVKLGKEEKRTMWKKRKRNKGKDNWSYRGRKEAQERGQK